MQSVSKLIDFLMNLLRDEHAQSQFEQDPQAALAARGLDNVTGQDVRDARLIMADDDAVHPRPGGARSHHSQSGHAHSGHDDPVREIRHTTRHYEPSGPGAADGGYHYNAGDVSQTFNIVNIDDGDTLVVDSFNSDDDGIDNKNGEIKESVLAGDDLNGQVGVDNADTAHVLAINESFNEDNSTSTDVDILSIKDSLNEATATTPAPGGPPSADQPPADQPSAEQPSAEQPSAEHPADLPVIDPPTTDTATDPVVSIPAAGDPVVDDSPPEDPIADHHIADDPVAVDPEPAVPVDDEPDLDSADHVLV
ncbi:MAG TPA: IniB N-terminal domain-containing protein [Pseudonocardiaceae bacterium]